MTTTIFYQQQLSKVHHILEVKLIYSCYGINLVELMRHHCVTKMWMIVARKLWCECVLMFSALVDREFVYRNTSYTVLQIYNIVHSLTLCYTILHDDTLSYTILRYYTLLYTIISLSGRQVFDIATMRVSEIPINHNNCFRVPTSCKHLCTIHFTKAWNILMSAQRITTHHVKI